MCQAKYYNRKIHTLFSLRCSFAVCILLVICFQMESRFNYLIIRFCCCCSCGRNFASANQSIVVIVESIRRCFVVDALKAKKNQRNILQCSIQQALKMKQSSKIHHCITQLAKARDLIDEIGYNTRNNC